MFWNLGGERGRTQWQAHFLPALIRISQQPLPAIARLWAAHCQAVGSSGCPGNTSQELLWGVQGEAGAPARPQICTLGDGVQEFQSLLFAEPIPSGVLGRGGWPNSTGQGHAGLSVPESARKRTKVCGGLAGPQPHPTVHATHNTSTVHYRSYTLHTPQPYYTPQTAHTTQPTYHTLTTQHTHNTAYLEHTLHILHTLPCCRGLP